MNEYVVDHGANGEMENFTGADRQNAVRWLRRFTRKRVTKKNGAQVSTPIWLDKVDGYLGREAEKWANHTPAVRILLDENTLGQ